MKYAVISDLHANIEALDAVLAHIDRAGVDRIICLGDVVGYYADPNACVDVLRERDVPAVCGNHDRAALGVDEPVGFSREGRRAIEWTRQRLTDTNRAFLADLPVTRLVDRRLLLVHGSLHPAPNPYVHLSSPRRVRASLNWLMRAPPRVHVCLFGHTHHARVHELREGRLRSLSPTTVMLSHDAHYLINPGSVGQSRDPDWRASYVEIEDAAAATLVRFHRVEYERDRTEAKARAVGLVDPRSLFERLRARAELVAPR